MRTIIFFFTTIIIICLFSNCRKWDLEEVSDLDPCENVFCQNGGICINGNCQCPEGYSGTYCDIVPYVATTGQLMFWTDFDGPEIDIFVDGSYKGSINQKYTSTPSCNGSNTLTVTLEEGVYKVTGQQDGGNLTWEGNLTVQVEQCTSIPFETDKKLSKIKINSITIKDFDAADPDDNSNWDSSSDFFDSSDNYRPDLAILIHEDVNNNGLFEKDTEYYFFTCYFPNQNTYDETTFVDIYEPSSSGSNCEGDFPFLSTQTHWGVRIYDYDLVITDNWWNSADFMGGLKYNFSNTAQSKSYAPVFTSSSSSTYKYDIEFEFNVEWIYE